MRARCAPCRRAVERGPGEDEEFVGRVRLEDVVTEPLRRRAYLHACGATSASNGDRQEGLDARAGATNIARVDANILSAKCPKTGFLRMAPWYVPSRILHMRSGDASCNFESWAGPIGKFKRVK